MPPDYEFKCRLCGAEEPRLRLLDEPMDLMYHGVHRRLPRGSCVCYRHLQEFRGTPGRYITRRDMAHIR